MPHGAATNPSQRHFVLACEATRDERRAHTVPAAGSAGGWLRCSVPQADQERRDRAREPLRMLEPQVVVAVDGLLPAPPQHDAHSAGSG